MHAPNGRKITAAPASGQVPRLAWIAARGAYILTKSGNKSLSAHSTVDINANQAISRCRRPLAMRKSYKICKHQGKS